MGHTTATNQATDRKRHVRSARWNELRELGAARFPGARGRVPNFTGAEAAAERLVASDAFHRARVVLCGPWLAQRPVRLAALRAGKRVIVSDSGLRSQTPFRCVDPEGIEARDLWDASAITRVEAYGIPLHVDDVPRIQLIVVGSVGVARDGARVGKGGGASDLEYGILRTLGCVGPRTPIVTTVHPSQVVAKGKIPMLPHDVPVDVIVTPERSIACAKVHPRPAGVRWDDLTQEAIDERPVLATLVGNAGRAGRRNPA